MANVIRKIAKLMFGGRITDKLFLKFPCWANFNKNLSRLYPFLVVGGSEAYRAFRQKPLDKQKVVDLTLPRQTIFACTECIRSFFSILREGSGAVCLAVTECEIRNESKELLPLHYAVFRDFLHPGTNNNRRKVRYPLLFQPLWILECLGINLCRARKANGMVANLQVINEFCKERGLSFLLVALGEWKEETLQEIDSQGINHCHEQEFRDMVARSKLKCISF